MAQRTKDFDCVEMKHRGADKILEITRGMTRAEELAFWTEGTQQLKREKDTLERSKSSEREA